jgi:hypothetical protein
MEEGKRGRGEGEKRRRGEGEKGRRGEGEKGRGVSNSRAESGGLFIQNSKSKIQNYFIALQGS